MWPKEEINVVRNAYQEIHNSFENTDRNVKGQEHNMTYATMPFGVITPPRWVINDLLFNRNAWLRIYQYA